jgi:hypothetical protein
MNGMRVTVKAYLEKQIELLRSEMCTWERGHIEKHGLELTLHNTERDASRDMIEALVKEIGHRLEVLNNHAKQLSDQQVANALTLSDQQRTYVLRIVYDNLVESIDRRFSETAKCTDIESILFKLTAQDAEHERFRALEKVVAQNSLLIKSQANELERLRLLEANIRGQIIAYSAVASLIVGVLFFIAGKLW